MLDIKISDFQTCLRFGFAAVFLEQISNNSLIRGLFRINKQELLKRFT